MSRAGCHIFRGTLTNECPKEGDQDGEGSENPIIRGMFEGLVPHLAYRILKGGLDNRLETLGGLS